MSGYIYKLYHDKYYYYGQTTNDIDVRAEQHWSSRHQTSKLYTYMKNTNKCDWTIEEIEQVPIHQLNAREAFYINLSDPYCLNTSIPKKHINLFYKVQPNRYKPAVTTSQELNTCIYHTSCKCNNNSNNILQQVSITTTNPSTIQPDHSTQIPTHSN